LWFSASLVTSICMVTKPKNKNILETEIFLFTMWDWRRYACNQYMLLSNMLVERSLYLTRPIVGRTYINDGWRTPRDPRRLAAQPGPRHATLVDGLDGGEKTPSSTYRLANTCPALASNDTALELHSQRLLDTAFSCVRSHTNTTGNERADKLTSMAARVGHMDGEPRTTAQRGH